MLHNPQVDRGELCWGQFVKQRTLGRGASGVAELVQRKSDGMLLVIKVIPVRWWWQSCVVLIGRQVKGLAEEEAANNEVKILTELKHPQIIEYQGTFTHNSCLHILMEYADGANCSKCLELAMGRVLRYCYCKQFKAAFKLC